MIIGAKISMQLTNLGYEVTGILPRGEEAIVHVKENRPDIVLLDVNLKGAMDGIATARQIQQFGNIPIIYITANSDEATFNRAKSTRPAAFIAKPYKQLDLQRAVELTVSRLPNQEPHVEEKPVSAAGSENATDKHETYILSDRIFVRHKEKMVKIMIADILFVEAERNYSRIYTQSKEHLLSVTLKTIEEKFPPQLFVRIHRSYIINVMHVDEVEESHVVIARKTVPISAGLKEQLMQRIYTL